MFARVLSLLIMLLPLVSLADVLNPNDAPLFWSILNEDPKYHDAAFKAQEAFFVQSGVTPFTGKLNNYVTDKTTNAVVGFIDNDTPFTAKSVFFVIGTAYTVCVKKQITKSFRDPLWERLTHTVSVSPDAGSANVSISF
jgi:hypothetical protein